MTILRLLAALLCLCPVIGLAETRTTLPSAWRLSYEGIPISIGTMGTMGLHYDITPARQLPWLYLGLGTYGGLTGEEGGFFTLGGTVGARQSLTPGLTFDAGLHVGGGGGSRFTFPGGGLFVRSHAAIEFGTGAIGWRIGVAHTEFPNTVRPGGSDTHLFVGIRRAALDWRPAGDDGQVLRTFDGANRTFRASSAGMYYLTSDRAPLHRDGSYTGGAGTNADFALLGFRLEQFVSPHLFHGLEVYGAGGGGADGYAAVLLTLGHATRLGPLDWENRISAGMAGDGRLDTGGGFLAQASTGLTLGLGRNWFVRGGLGYAIAPQGKLRATAIDLGLGWRAARPIPAQAGSYSFGPAYRPVTWSTAFGHKTYLPAAASRNKSGNPYDPALHLIGLTASYPIGDWLHVSGSTHWAWGGNIGSYAEGLLGAGIGHSIGQRWSWAITYEAGVAGGGVAELDGGPVHQVTAGLGYRLSDDLTARLSIGHMESLGRSFRAQSVGLHIDWQHRSLFLH